MRRRAAAPEAAEVTEVTEVTDKTLVDHPHRLGPRLCAAIVDRLTFNGAIIDEDRCHRVTDYHDSAARFRQRHRFKFTGRPEPWQGKLPNLRMIRSV
ncbi:hypothetical protein ACIO87_21185 [Streptomyces sp. NPDC087218]|uniref:hypothetical protein n=1 Tax=Streptomyces sp. NPDC087218 TaxID=3365769 RepID=UPI0038024138